MTSSVITQENNSFTAIHALVLISGLAALSWEVVWQLKSSLALGVSAWGTALTLAVTMGGMSAGSLLMGYYLKDKPMVRPLQMYGVLEMIVGLSGILLIPAFMIVGHIDSWAYAALNGSSSLVHLLGIACTLGVPTFCLGATIPVIGLAAQQYKTSIALLYGLNTLGAAVGALMAAFIFIPLLGVTLTIFTISLINLCVGVVAFKCGQTQFFKHETLKQKKPHKDKVTSIFSSRAEFLIVFVTGFATFTLEVAWFRSFTAAFFSTTAAFSIMLSCVLIALGVGARLVPLMKKKSLSLGSVLAVAGILILFMTPIIERFDYLAQTQAEHPFMLYLNWFVLTLYFIFVPVMCLGVPLPWILDDQTLPRKWGALYSFNALSSVLGALCAGWLFLPLIGFAKTSWLIGVMVVVAGLVISPQHKKRLIIALTGLLALGTALIFESGVGTRRVQLTTTVSSPLKEVLKSLNGPDATVSAVLHENGERTLVIDGFVATSQPPDQPDDGFLTLYMEWMGYLPMLLHPSPQHSLVIAFGTGQTANAVRKENPKTLDIVDINKSVFQLAPYFTSNEGILDDQKVNKIVMDGRAYLRRSSKIYDVITLEPMPPTFAGVNALYSKEFYELAYARLSSNGIIAQWLPFHIVAPFYSASVAQTFQAVFPNSILWIDPSSLTGILLGSKDNDVELGVSFPGYERSNLTRSLSEQDVRAAILLNKDELSLYSAKGAVITDDNQMLSYGGAVNKTHELGVHTKGNFEWLSQIKKDAELQ